MTKPTVIILAAGRNSRFFPINTTTHKGFIELLGQRMIDRTLDNLQKYEFTKVVLVMTKSDLESSLCEDLETNFPNIEFIFLEQPEALGMGNALLKAKDVAGDRFAVVRPELTNAGEILDRMLTKSQETNQDVVVCAIPTKSPWLYGILTIKDDKAVALVEKPAKGEEPSDLKIEAVYLLNQKYLQLLEAVPEEEYAYEIALNQLMAEAGGLPAIHIQKELPSQKYPWHLFDFQQEFFEHLESFIDSTAKVAKTAIIDESKGKVYIGKNAQVGHAARIVGPAFIGENVIIGDFSLIRQSSLEMDSVAGAYSELVRSIILKNSTYHSGYIADSIVGHNVRIGAGIITANKRHDRQNINIRVKGRKVSLDRNNFGTIIGDNAKLGISVRTMPGVLIGSNTVIYPNICINRDVADSQTVEKQ